MYLVTNASVYESHALESLLDEEDIHQELYVDTTYADKNKKKRLKNMN
jgi:hypothetical protein